MEGNNVKKAVAIVLVTLFLISGCQSKEDNINPKQGVYYEIFVRSFADSNGDGIGDIKGITAKLDYLNDGDSTTQDDLGVSGIWLTPIMTSPTYHKYDVVDYYNVDPEYGTLEDVEVLIEEAHKRGIAVIIDLVVNHTSLKNEWFIKSKAGDPKYRDYYEWTTKDTTDYKLKGQVFGHNVWNKVGDDYYYALFWDQMPDLNFDNEAVRKELKNVAKFWLDLGVDGFRLDAAKHIYSEYETLNDENLTGKNVAWWEEFRTYTQSVKKDTLLVAEVWDDTEIVQQYCDVFDVLFNFEAAGDILKTVKTSQNRGNLSGKLETTYQAYLEGSAQYVDAPFLTNHDQNRIMTEVVGDESNMKLATMMYMTLPGMPFIYYGEELGMQGRKPDENIREAFLWGEGDLANTSWIKSKYNKKTTSVATQLSEPTSMLSFYSEIIRLRAANAALGVGSFTAVAIDNIYLMGYIRETSGQKLLVIHNVGGKDASYELSTFVSKSVLYVNGGAALAETTVTLPAKSTIILELTQDVK